MVNFLSQRLVAVALIVVFHWAHESFAFDVSSFYPQGEASDIKQIRASFSEDMVPAGDPDRPAPMIWDCGIKGQSVWIDSKTWTLNLVDALPLGTSCKFSVKEGLQALSGSTLAFKSNFEFSAGGLRILDSRPYSGSNVAEDQTFGFVANAKIDRQSLKDHVFLEVKGVRNRIGMTLIEGKMAEDLFKVMFGWDRDQKRDFFFLKPDLALPTSGSISVVFQKGLRSVTGSTLSDHVVFPFTVREPFTLSMSCSRDNVDSACSPLQPVSVVFSSEIDVEEAAKIKIAGPSGAVIQPLISDYDKERGYLRHFALPAKLDPGAGYTISLLAAIKDTSGRDLANAGAFPLSFTVAEYPSLAKFATDFGVVEFDSTAAVPITARNLESDIPIRVLSFTSSAAKSANPLKTFLKRIVTGRSAMTDQYAKAIDYFEKIQTGTYERSRYLKPTIDENESVGKISIVKLPKRHPSKSMEVVGIPVEEPGFHVYEVKSEALASSYLTKDEGKTMYVPAAFMVTNLAVHLKVGRENSLAWVTELNSGAPAKGAKVTVMNCDKKVVWTGTASDQGVVEFKGDLASLAGNCRSFIDRVMSQRSNDRSTLSPFYVFAQLNDDFSFTRSDWDSGIEHWRLGVDTGLYEGQSLVASSVLDRNLLRAGERVSFKHYIRAPSIQGLQFAKMASLYDTLEIRHSGTNELVKVRATWHRNGTGDSFWDIPKSAKLGTYVATLKGKSQRPLEVAYFSVQEFRLPLTKAFLKVPPKDLISPKEIPLQMGIQYLSGGGVAGATANLVSRYIEYPYRLNSKTFEDFSFNNGRIQKDRNNYGSDVRYSDYVTTPITADAQGQMSHTVPVQLGDRARTYTFELSYLDPNGDTRSFVAEKKVIPDTWSIGIDRSKWMLKSKKVDVKAVLLDENAAPLAGKQIDVRFVKRTYISHRRKVAGGVYDYENKVEWNDFNIKCSGKTNSKGEFSCSKDMPTYGHIIAEVSAVNKDGSRIYSNHEFELFGGADAQWYGSDVNDRMDLLADKKEYDPGETATIHVRAPFKDYWALVTAEREGVLSHKVLRLSSAAPLVEFPVTAAHAPNVYVSVLAVRGRLNGEKPTFMVDLSKPAFKLGLTNLKVNWKAQRLNVEVKPEKEVYTTRDEVKANISVKSADGSPLNGPTEVAVAVVDEGLLELQNNTTWNLLEEMMGLRPYGVRSATSQIHVVGKRHYGLKAMNLGGGGDAGLGSSPRELFDTLLTWQPHVPVDSQGRAVVTFKLNDSMTAFKIVAIANHGTAKFGTGSASIRSNKDVILFSGIPPIVRSGDQFDVRITARNTMTTPVDVQIKSFVRGGDGKNVQVTPVSISADKTETTLFKYKEILPPGEYQLETVASVADRVVDIVWSKFRVIPTVVARVQQGQLLQIPPDHETTFEAPQNALPGQGGIKISASKSIVGGLDAVEEFARSYPYSCYEQQMSKLLMLDDKAGFEKLEAATKSYLDSQGLLKYFPTSDSGSQILTAYALQISHARGWKYSRDVREKMLAGLRGFIRGRMNDARAADRFTIYSRVSALDAISRYQNLSDDDVSFIPQDVAAWPTSAVLDLIGLAHRGKDLSNREQLIKIATNTLQARISMFGSRMGFQTESSDGYGYLMVDPDGNAFRTVLTAIEFGLWREQWGKYMAGALGRLKTGAASLTTSNAWGAVAVRSFSEQAESKTVSGSTDVRYAGVAKSIGWSSKGAKGDVDFGWQAGPQAFSVKHSGEGSPWVSIFSSAAIDRKEPFFNGIKVVKAVDGLRGADVNNLKVGDVVRVKLTVTTQSELNWLVVNDPVPSGTSIVDKGLGNESTSADLARAGTGIWPVFVESAFDAVRAYYEYVDDSTFTYSYALRINNVGTFTLPVTRVEAMYAPEIFAELPNKPWIVQR